MAEIDEFEQALANEQAEFEQVFAAEQQQTPQDVLAPPTQEIAQAQPIAQEFFQPQQQEQISTTAGQTTGARREDIEAAFPRATGEQQQGSIGGLFDLMSLPGRVAATSLFQGDNESFQQALGRVEAPEEAGFLRAMAENVLRDPATPAMVVPGVGLGARALSAGSRIAKLGKIAAVGAGEGALGGTIHQADIAAQGGDPSIGALAAETALGAIIPTGLTGIGMGLKRMGPAARKQASKLSGVSEDALKMWGTGFGIGSKKLKALAGRQREIGNNLLKALEDKISPFVKRKPGEVSFDDFIKEENDIVNQAMLKMEPIPLKNTIDVIKDEIGSLPLQETQKGIRSKLEKLLVDIGGKKQLSDSRVSMGRDVNTILKQLPSSKIPMGREVKTVQKQLPSTTISTPGKKIKPGTFTESTVSPTTRTIKGGTVPEQSLGAEKFRTVKGGEISEKLLGPEKFRTIRGKEIFSTSSSPKQFKDRQNALSNIIDWNAPNAKVHNQAIKNIRRAMKDELEAAAVKTGNPKYVEAMASMNRKLDARDNILDLIGRDAKKRSLKIEAFTDQIFGKNKSAQRELFKELEKAVGPEFLESAKVSKLADQLGMTLEHPSPSFFPGGLKSTLTNIATGGISSPPISAPITQSLETVGGLAGKAIGADPTRKTLSQLSRSSAFGASND